MASFLKYFDTILHATEVAAAIAAPIIATFEPTIGGLMSGATAAAVSVEASITTPGSGAQKAVAVAASTQAAINVTNSILQSQGKAPLPTYTAQVINQQVKAVVMALNGIATAVEKAPTSAQ